MRGLAVFGLTGRLVANPVFHQVGKGLVKFTVAVNRMGNTDELGKREEVVDYFDCQVWCADSESGGLGGVVDKHCVKGTAVSFSGRMHQERWQKNGETRSKVVFEVRDLCLLGSPDRDGEPASPPPPPPPSSPHAPPRTGYKRPTNQTKPDTQTQA